MSNYKHPGKDLRAILHTTGDTKGEAANKLGIERSNLSEVFSGKRDITPMLAVKLEAAYPTYFNANIWAVKQLLFDVQEAAKKHGREKGKVCVVPTNIGEFQPKRRKEKV